MAIIGKIREKFSTLLLILVGGAMLAYILSSFLGQGGSMFSSRNDTVAIIGGKKITYPEFQQKVDEAIANYKKQQNTDQVNEQVTAYIRNSVWQQMLNDILLKKQLNKLGITVSSEELFDLVQGKDPAPAIKKAFSDPKTGVFSRARVLGFLKNLDKQKPEVQQEWFQFEKSLRKQRTQNKYYKMISEGLYATSLQAEDQFQNQNSKYNIEYVLKPYNTVADSTISVSDDELENYYDAHKYLYTQKAGRDIEYVSYPIIASAKDSADILKQIAGIKTRLQTSKDDSMFVSLNSDSPFDTKFYSKGGGLPARLDTILFTGKVANDSVIGPFVNKGNYELVKISKTKYSPDSVHARHILISVDKNTPDSIAKAMADSLEKVIKSGGNFAALAAKYSKDPGSAMKGGDLGWFKEGQMVPAFNDFCFDGKKGDIGVVKSRFGYHIIEILDQSTPVKKLQVAILTKQIMASNKTYEAVFNEASAFSINNSTPESFEKTAKQKRLNIRKANVAPSAISINNLQSPKDLISWTNKAKEGKVSEPFRLGNEIVVAALTKIKEKGFAPLEDVKDQVKQAVIQHKKAQIITKELQGAKDINALAQKLKTQLKVAKDITFGSYAIRGMGREPAVQGAIFALKKGQMSQPIEGNAGVYVVYAAGVITMNLPKKDIASQQLKIEQSISKQVNGLAFQALVKQADVKDHRNKFY